MQFSGLCRLYSRHERFIRQIQHREAAKSPLGIGADNPLRPGESIGRHAEQPLRQSKLRRHRHQRVHSSALLSKAVGDNAAMSSPSTKTAPYGSWKSPITSDLIVAQCITLSELCLDGGHVYWLEGRPQEQGRYVVVRADADGQPTDITPPPYNSRTRVHEYGGGSWDSAAAVHGVGSAMAAVAGTGTGGGAGLGGASILAAGGWGDCRPGHPSAEF